MTKPQEIITLVLMAVSFGLGYGMRNSMVTNVTDQTLQVKDDHTVITTVTHKDPSGDVKVTRTIDSDIKIKTNEVKQVSVPAAPNKTNISALAGYDFTHVRALTPVYGVSVTREVLGPITVGAFGLTNGVVGISLGVSF